MDRYKKGKRNIFLFLITIAIFGIWGCTKEDAETTELTSGDLDYVLQKEHIPEAFVSDADLKLPEITEIEELADTAKQNDETEQPEATELPEATEVYLSMLDSPQTGSLIDGDGGIPVYFYTQTDTRWAQLYYGGTDTIEKYACGPTSMSIVISSLTDIIIDPVQMSAWANANGYWYPESGSLHSLIPDAAAAFGLIAEGVENTPAAAEIVKEALIDGKLVVVLMGKGYFTEGGHFIVLRGIDDDGSILVADAASEERTKMSWDLSVITSEAKTWAAANGPYWIISQSETE